MPKLNVTMEKYQNVEKNKEFTQFISSKIVQEDRINQVDDIT